jgi:hypothetical protein
MVRPYALDGTSNRVVRREGDAEKAKLLGAPLPPPTDQRANVRYSSFHIRCST